MTTTKTTPRASIVFWRAEHHNINCTMMSLLCLSSLIVYVIVVTGVVLQKCPSQSWCSTTSKKSHVLALPSSSFVTVLPLLPSQSSHPINRNVINCGHRHCCGYRLLTAVAAAPAVVTTIERRRIPFARLRMASSRRCRGLAPSHPS